MSEVKQRSDKNGDYLRDTIDKIFLRHVFGVDYYIIPRTDNPADWVEKKTVEYGNHDVVELKWREGK